MAKVAQQGRAMSKRVLYLDTRGIEVEVEDGEIRLLVDATLPLPFKAFDIIEAWAEEVDGLDALVFREQVGEFVGKKMDEHFLISRLR